MGTGQRKRGVNSHPVPRRRFTVSSILRLSATYWGSERPTAPGASAVSDEEVSGLASMDDGLPTLGEPRTTALRVLQEQRMLKPAADSNNEDDSHFFAPKRSIASITLCLPCDGSDRPAGEPVVPVSVRLPGIPKLSGSVPLSEKVISVKGLWRNESGNVASEGDKGLQGWGFYRFMVRKNVA